ncbi:hypothetical protein conserved [Leishmania donovani]|uniref:Hypothetical_protein_conserved n=1 Tax=Leishmania donovani TaxID=5661 RepID=A0A3S5H6P6_LEIDO|nr:hypothetical protein LdCL_130016900 [Leishmania donovani]TPP50060.1 hypothetical protein CGC20_17035 [Leishmania donovani]CAJ1987216.1 hypothetical protein conserved [Leishmania donovani]VDZ43105.1 hypothetical_protein_conserved [Leishmania donovani]
MPGLEKKDIISTPVPFPTIPIQAVPRNKRSWVQNNWWVLLTIECLALFVAFAALLAYYLLYVRTPGRRLLEDKVDKDGLSHYGSELSSRSSSVELEESRASCKCSTTTKRSFAGNAAGGTVDSRKSHRSTPEVVSAQSLHSKTTSSHKRD